MKATVGSSQTTMGNDGSLWQYEADRVRDRMARFVIQETLSFDHFDNHRMTTLIKETLQPRYCHMFECALRQRITFHEHLARENENIMPSRDSHWETIELISELLDVFKNATTLLSIVYYPTSCLVLSQLYLMTRKLNEFGMKFPNLTGPIKKKLIKYFKELLPVMICATALNLILNRFGDETIINNIAYDLGLTDEEDTFVSRQVASFNAAFDNIFQVYLNKYGSSASNIHSMHQEAGSSSCGSNASMQMYNRLVHKNRKEARANTPSSDLGRYVASDFLGQMSIEEFNNLDILGWWKARESQFPVLAAIPRDLLSVQASTVASKSAFPVTGRVISPRRKKFTPTSVEVCICLKDHLDSMERIQHISPLEGELERVEEQIHAEEIAMNLADPIDVQQLEYGPAPAPYYGAPIVYLSYISQSTTLPQLFLTVTLNDRGWNMDMRASSHLADSTCFFSDETALEIFIPSSTRHPPLLRLHYYLLVNLRDTDGLGILVKISNGTNEGNVGQCLTPFRSNTTLNEGTVPLTRNFAVSINVTDSPTNPSNFGNGVDVVISLESIRAVSKHFANIVYGFFLEKHMAYPVVENDVKNTRSKMDLSNQLDYGSDLLREDVGNVWVLVNFPTFPMTGFSEDGSSVIATKLDTPLMLDSYASNILSATPIAERIDKLERKMIDGKLMLVDNDGKPQSKVACTVNANSDSEVEDILLEQWRETKVDDDYEPYDDDLYDAHDISEKLLALC
ncbi:zinc finger BED domain-containing protein RICESLEEPER 2-like protein [Tanacetum coccineum]